MKKLVLVGLFLLLMSSFVLADMSISNVKKYDMYGRAITGRTYFVSYDRVELDAQASTRSDISLQAQGFGGSNCREIRRGTLKYHCIYYISPFVHGPTTMFVEGLNYVTKEVTRTDLFQTFFNPLVLSVGPTTPIVFGTLKPGTTVYSNAVQVVTTTEASANANIYLKGANTYSPVRALCGYSNSFPYYYIQYSVNGGAWRTISTKYTLIGQNNINVMFRANVPSPCVGEFDIAKRISFTAEVAK